MFRLLRRVAASQCPYAASHHLRPLSTTATVLAKSMPPRPKVPPDNEIEESYLKGSGPGGQKINKTNSAVQIKHIPTGIVVKSQATRSREQNRKHARELLAQKIDDLHNGEQSRSAIVGGVRKKRADSAAKKSRRKYRKLEEARDKDGECDGGQAVSGQDEHGGLGGASSQSRILEQPHGEPDRVAPIPDATIASDKPK